MTVGPVRSTIPEPSGPRTAGSGVRRSWFAHVDVGLAESDSDHADEDFVGPKVGVQANGFVVEVPALSRITAAVICSCVSSVVGMLVLRMAGTGLVPAIGQL